MKSIFTAFLSVTTVALAWSGVNCPALAAAPALCALYAREYATAQNVASAAQDSATLLRTQDHAYYHCLNMDELPRFPATSAYFGKDLAAITGDAPDETLSEASPAIVSPDVSAGGDAGIAKPVVPKPKRQAKSDSHRSHKATAARSHYLTAPAPVAEDACTLQSLRRGSNCADRTRFWRGLM
jgi:hypothetical protein